MGSSSSDKDELVAFVQSFKEAKDTTWSSNWFTDLTVQARRAQLKLIPGGKQDAGINSHSPLNVTNTRARPWRP